MRQRPQVQVLPW